MASYLNFPGSLLAPLMRRWQTSTDVTLRGRARVVVKLAVSLILVTFVLRKVEGDQLAVRVSGQSIAWLAAAGGLTLAQFLTLAVRWDQILRGLRLPVGWCAVLSATYVGAFFNCWLLGTVGGDAARAMLLPGGTGGRATVIHSVLFDRIAALGGLGLVVLPLVVFNSGPMAYSASVLVSLGIVTIPFIGLALIEPMNQSLSRYCPSTLAFIARLARASRMLRHSGRCSAALAASALSQIVLSLIPYCLARAQHLDISPIEFLLAMPPVVLLVALPVSAGGWGVRESAMIAGLAPYGVAPGAALLISVEMGVLAAVLSLPAGATWLYRYVLFPETYGGTVIPHREST